ncbi:hypothetical protein ALP73_200065 [Pseudomonas coronafaciens pv. garcae]|uniref:hypothetical protein n=1 Tax=Pseudomonas syringae group TaxID=136849 RepID=UPI000EFF3823|nr:hypothetical protein [Pseudomonas coronafaciens]RMS04944.1 hypothetical protein ALP73_200065 [Pseudomonas coronafaciens pv. garcae]
MQYLKSLFEKHRHGPWRAILGGYGILCLFSGIGSAWGNYHFVSSALLWTLTHALYLPFLFGFFFASVWVGMTIGRVSRLQILGWIAGIATAFTLVWLISKGISHIPGIGWRFTALLDHASGDY